MNRPSHFITIADHEPAALRRVLEVGEALRTERRAGKPHEPMLANRSLAMLFEKPSLRTRVSFELAMRELGGRAIRLASDEVGLGKRESVADVVRVLSGMVDVVAARVFKHGHLEEMARFGSVPVINLLSDRAHPCQALADVMTMRDEYGAELTGRTVAFVGDGNNVACSLAWLCAKLGVRYVHSGPAGYELPSQTIEAVRADCPDARLELQPDPAAAVAEADAIYCDTFTSMGQEAEAAERERVFADYQVNDALLAEAPAHAIVLHCLPAHRNVEITDAVMDGPRSRVFQQAHNRLHAQKGLLAVMLGGA
jgi:ornithine carbamoyltransferase